MNFSFMQSEFVVAMGWTLIHSLWQGLLLALVTGAMLVITRRSDARKRYELLTGLFFLFLGVTAVTFIREIYLASAHTYTASIGGKLASRSVIGSILPFTETHIAVSRSWMERMKDYFTEHAYLLVTIWFVIFVARFIKLISELAYIQRIRYYRTSTPGEVWKERVQALAEKMEIKIYVQLLESTLIKVPVVMGILKPLILVPAGMLTRLPADEVEAILLHELAHIRRRDYFINLLQSFAETVFFFNPALMWLSSLIREERENCCDDLAIAVTNNRTKFIDALISFQEFDLQEPQYGIGFTGKKYPLLNRVKRIITNRNTSLNTSEKSILTLGIAILVLCSFVAAKKIPQIAKAMHQSTAAKKTVTPIASQAIAIQPAAIHQNEKAATIDVPFAAGYQPVQHDTIIAPPPVWVSPTVNVAIKTDTLADDFKNYSTNLYNNGKDRTLVIKATTRQGTQYTLSSVNDVISELKINGTSITGADLLKYDQLISDIKRPYEIKQASIELEKQRAEMRHDLNATKQAIAEINKYMQHPDSSPQNNTQKKVLKNDKWVLASEFYTDSTKTKLLEKQQELNRRLDNLDKREEPFVKKDTAFRKINLKASVSVKDDHGQSGLVNVRIVNGIFKVDNLEKYPSSDVNVYNKNAELVKHLEDYKNDWSINRKDAKITSGVYYYTIQLGPDKKATVKGFVTLGPDAGVQLTLEKQSELKVKLNEQKALTTNFSYKRIALNEKANALQLLKKEDSLRHELQATQQKLASLRKDASMEQKQQEEEMRYERQAEQIRNIISDLEKEHIKVDIKKGWFALDKNRFIIDGKTMTPAIRKRFVAKYVVPNKGMGYFYGPIQLEGKGIFMDYRDLNR